MKMVGIASRPNRPASGNEGSAAISCHPASVHLRLTAIGAMMAVAACGGQTDRPFVDGGLEGAADSPPDVAADAPRVWCVDTTSDGGGMFCPPGMICGNSGGISGNCCCYPQGGMESYYCPC